MASREKDDDDEHILTELYYFLVNVTMVCLILLGIGIIVDGIERYLTAFKEWVGRYR
ncbi:hypothetical protein BDD12DRAFT_882319 [Trichophaea hybrida]|nr:hypothetical protein BDD12DRAFT_882319 [Trichophaea hybrida]